MAHYIHHVPGRLRVNTPVLKKNEFRARQLKSYLEGMNGVLQAETSIVTGSVVIRYDRCLVSSTSILDFLHDLGYIQNTGTLSGPCARDFGNAEGGGYFRAETCGNCVGTISCCFGRSADLIWREQILLTGMLRSTAISD